MHKIVITDPVRLRAAIEFAQNQGCLEQFGVDLCNMLRVLTGSMIEGHDENDNLIPAKGAEVAELGYDFAPYSFSFAIWRDGGDFVFRPERSQLVLNGGWIYSGPGVPSDGSFPSLTVDLDDVMGKSRPTHKWRCHT